MTGLTKEFGYMLTIELFPKPEFRHIAEQVKLMTKRNNISDKDKRMIAESLMMYSAALIKSIPKDKKDSIFH